MPKLIVYVKADTWRRVVDSAGADAPALARALSVEAIEEFVAEKAAATDTPFKKPRMQQVGVSSNVGAGKNQPAADNPDPHFRPDFK